MKNTDTSTPKRAARRVALLSFVLALSGSFAASAGSPGMRSDQIWLVTKAGERQIEVEVAVTAEEMATGLMFRTSLADDRGMLFPSPAPREAQMWMRNTYISLDMVFIRADGVIHRIEPRTEPLSERIVASNGEVLAVLELAGGAAERLGLAAGDRVRHPVFGAIK
jgi:uncharacterized protein